MSTRKRLGLKSIAKSITAGLWMFLASKVVSAAETDAIGRVDMVEGVVYVIRDGEKIALGKNDPIFQGDTIFTGEDGSIGVTFIDDTIFSLGEGGEMTVDEMVYDPDKQEGKFAANMVKGVFSFISGEIAKTDPEGMSLNTPVGVIGIRGTKIAGVAAAEGTENTISLLPEMGKDGQSIVGELVMTNSSGSVVLNQVGATVQLTSANQAPPPPVILDKQQIQQSYGKTLTTLSSTVVVKATNDAIVAEEKVAEAQQEVEVAEQEAEEAVEAAEEAKVAAEESGDKEAIEEAEKLAEIAEEKMQEVEIAKEEVEVAKEVVVEIKEVVEVAKQEFEVQKEAFKEFVVDEKPEEQPQEQEKPADAKEGDDADAPNEEGGEEGDAPEGDAPEGPIEGEGEELLEEGEGEELLKEGEGEKPPEEVLLEEGPPEGEKPAEIVEGEDAPIEINEEKGPEVVEEKPVEIIEEKPVEQVVEVAPEPVIEAPKPVMEAPKPIPIAPIMPDVIFVAPIQEQIIFAVPEPIVYNVQEVVEEAKFTPKPMTITAAPKVFEYVEEETVVEETVLEVQPNLLGVGGTGDTIDSTMNIGYYSMSNGQGLSKQIAPIEEAGHNAVKMTTLSETELASVDILWALNPSNSSHGSEFTNAIDRIKERVDEGMILVIHDRQVGNAENILFGEEPAEIIRGSSYSRKIDVVDENTVVGEGPGGLLTDTSIDGGNSSNHGYTKKDTLPDDSLALLNNSDEDQIVDFAYKYGSGAVIYSSIPLDYYLGGAMPNFKDIYAPNVLQFAASLITDGYNTIQGTNSSEIIAGTANDDTLKGLDGNDTIFGLYGDDKIEGGAGADMLKGGSGSDVYIYKSLSDSPAGSGDTITDFDETNDRINIRDITTTFNIVPSFTGNTSTHEVVYNANTKLLQMDADGDKVADMEITLENYTGTFDYGTNESTNFI